MGIEHQAADVSYNGDALMRDNVTSAERIAIPESWRRKYVDFTAMGADLYVRFGDETVTVDIGTETPIDGSGVPSFGGAEPHLIVLAGQTKPARIDRSHTHFAHVASAAAGHMHAVDSTGDGD